MKYETIRFLGEADAEAAIGRDDPAELRYVPISVGLHAANLAWAQAVCIRLARHRDSDVRANAILGLGHLARRFKQLDRAQVEPLVRSGLSDSNENVRGHAQDALDDLRQFLGWNGPAV